MVYPCSFLLCLRLASELCDLDNNEFSRFEWCKGNDNVDNTVIDVGLSRRCFVALDLERLTRLTALEGSLLEEREHEAFYACAYRHPEGGIVRLKDDPA